MSGGVIPGDNNIQGVAVGLGTEVIRVKVTGCRESKADSIKVNNSKPVL